MFLFYKEPKNYWHLSQNQKWLYKQSQIIIFTKASTIRIKFVFSFKRNTLPKIQDNHEPRTHFKKINILDLGFLKIEKSLFNEFNS